MTNTGTSTYSCDALFFILLRGGRAVGDGWRCDRTRRRAFPENQEAVDTRRKRRAIRGGLPCRTGLIFQRGGIAKKYFAALPAASMGRDNGLFSLMGASFRAPHRDAASIDGGSSRCGFGRDRDRFCGGRGGLSGIGAISGDASIADSAAPRSPGSGSGMSMPDGARQPCQVTPEYPPSFQLAANTRVAAAAHPCHRPKRKHTSQWPFNSISVARLRSLAKTTPLTAASWG